MIGMTTDARETTAAKALTPYDQHLNTYLRQMLHDLAVVVPYDTAAAWLGHDERPALRVVAPDHAALPSIDGARHMVFQTTAEPARIADLQQAADTAGLRAWLGVPLVLHGRRRGWIELFSEQPNRFSDDDLRRVEIIVRHAAFGLEQLETAQRVQREASLDQVLLRGLHAGLHAPDLAHTLDQMIQPLALELGAAAAALYMPVELAYTLGLDTTARQLPSLEQSVINAQFVAQVARYDPAPLDQTADAHASDLFDGNVFVPLQHAGETLGWLALRYPSEHAARQVDATLLKRAPALWTALLVWMRDGLQREQQTTQSVRMLVQQMHQARSGTISELISGLAHELNNPVGAIAGMADLLGRDPTLNAEQQADTATIAAEARRIGELVQRLATFGVAARGSRQLIQLNDVVANTLAIAHGLAAQQSVTIASALPATSPLVQGNQAQLQQACFDLVCNALHAVADQDTPEVRIEVATEDRWGVIRVIDNGCGVPEDLQARIFLPGFTTKTTSGTRRGLGIGLPIAQEIMHHHAGAITLRSAIWQGSCFTLRLPLAV